MTFSASSPKVGTMLGTAQLGAILLQFAGLIWLGGRWSAEMAATGERVRELQAIVADLAKAQAQAAITDAAFGTRLELAGRRLDEIVLRLDRLDQGERVDRNGRQQ